MERSARPGQVHRITTARRSHSDDLDARIHRYLMSMAIRTVCVILVVIIDSPVRWLFAVGAVGLPYLAVVMANARGEPSRGQVLGPPPEQDRGLPASRDALPGQQRPPPE